MTSRLQRVADAIRQVGAKTGQARQDLAQAQRAAGRMTQSVVATGPAGRQVVSLLQVAQRDARAAEAALAEVATGAEAFARQLAGRGGGSSAGAVFTVMRGVVTTVEVLGIAFDLAKQVTMANAALPPPNRFLPPAAPLQAVVSQEKPVPWEKDSANLYTAYGLIEEQRLDQLSRRLGRKPGGGR